MVLVIRKLRYAHAEGHTDVCYARGGKEIVTCGNDGDVRRWDGIQDNYPISVHVADRALSVAISGDTVYVGTDDNVLQEVHLLQLSCGMTKCLRVGRKLTRFSAPVTHVAVCGNLIASCSNNGNIHIQNTNLPDELDVLAGHSAAVYGLAIDPVGIYLASSSGDGDVRVWNLKTYGVVKTLTGCVPVGTSFYLAETLGRPSWLPNTGRVLAVPQGKAVLLYERGTWTNEKNFDCSKLVRQPFTVTAFSACGHRLAACTSGGNILVWDVIEDICLGNVVNDLCVHVTSIAFNPCERGELAFGDFSGRLGVVQVLNSELKVWEGSREILARKPC